MDTNLNQKVLDVFSVFVSGDISRGRAMELLKKLTPKYKILFRLLDMMAFAVADVHQLHEDGKL